jgi:hypothetical protein
MFDRAGSNFNFLSFTNPQPISSVPFQFVSAATSSQGDEIFVTLNKEITSFSSVPGDFQVTVNGEQLVVESVVADPENNRGIIVSLQTEIRYQQLAKISYTGASILTGNAQLEAFTNKDVKNNLLPRFTIPAKIQAEAFFFNNGFQLEDCTDTGGGLNIGFANPGDYLDYLIYVPEAGEYTLDLRYATSSTTGKLDVRIGSGTEFTFVGSAVFPSTGGWQTWKNLQVRINLPQGSQTIRLYAVAGEFNINWFELSKPTAVEDSKLKGSLNIYPNPSKGIFKVGASLDKVSSLEITINDISGKTIFSRGVAATANVNESINLNDCIPGTYVLNVKSNNGSASAKIFVN